MASGRSETQALRGVVYERSSRIWIRMPSRPLFILYLCILHHTSSCRYLLCLCTIQRNIPAGNLHLRVSLVIPVELRHIHRPF